MIEKLMQFYKENPDAFADDVEDLGAWCDTHEGEDYIGYDRRYPMSELNDMFEDQSPKDVEETYSYSTDEDGGNFNPNRAYFCVRYNGGLYSTDNRDYRSHYLDEYAVKDIIDHASDLYLSDGAQAIINA